MMPMAQFGGHSHWVWQTTYNPQYDSLLLSAASDAQVNLWYHSSTVDSGSKAGSKGAPASSSQSRPYGKDSQKGRAFSYDDHEDSVYCKPHTLAVSCSRNYSCFIWICVAAS